MQTEVSFAKLHDDLFFNRKSFGKTLEPNIHGGLKMIYDDTARELLVTWQNKTAHIPSTNIASYCVGEVEDRKIHQTSAPMVAGISSAQVESPFGHVFEGPGKGKTK